MDNSLLVDPFVMYRIPVGDDLQVFSAVDYFLRTHTPLMKPAISPARIGHIGVVFGDLDSGTFPVRFAM